MFIAENCTDLSYKAETIGNDRIDVGEVGQQVSARSLSPVNSGAPTPPPPPVIAGSQTDRYPGVTSHPGRERSQPCS